MLAQDPVRLAAGCGRIAGVEFDITPEQASHGRVVKDAELPALAAQWLTQGFDSPTLREVAGLTRREGTEARQAFATVLQELGYPPPGSHFPWDERPWRGYWESIWWAVDRMDKTHTPYAAAQNILEILGDVPDLWEPGGGEKLASLLAGWDTRPVERRTAEDQIRAHLRSLREDAVPPLI